MLLPRASLRRENHPNTDRQDRKTITRGPRLRKSKLINNFASFDDHVDLSAFHPVHSLIDTPHTIGKRCDELEETIGANRNAFPKKVNHIIKEEAAWEKGINVRNEVKSGGAPTAKHAPRPNKRKTRPIPQKNKDLLLATPRRKTKPDLNASPVTTPTGRLSTAIFG